MDLVITVVDVKGKCSAHKLGDTFKLKDGYLLVSDIPVCLHALSALMPFYNALRALSPSELHLAGKDDEDKAYVQCPDAVTHTGGGCVVFEISKVG